MTMTTAIKWGLKDSYISSSTVPQFPFPAPSRFSSSCLQENETWCNSPHERALGYCQTVLMAGTVHHRYQLPRAPLRHAECLGLLTRILTHGQKHHACHYRAFCLGPFLVVLFPSKTCRRLHLPHLLSLRVADVG